MMNQNLQPNQPILIVSIHDQDERGVLAIDVLNIIEVIKDLTKGYVWIASDIDCVGGSLPNGKSLSTSELIAFTKGISQTIDGVIMGFPQELGRRQNHELTDRISDFPQSFATVAIVAVDSAYFEVYSKIPELIARIKATFDDVRDQNPDIYF